MSVLPVLSLLALGGCSLGGHEAAVMCEGFAEQRVGAELTFWGVEQYRTVGDDPQWTVHHGFVEPADGRATEMLCTIVDEGGQWRLLDLTTDRVAEPGAWAERVRSAGFVD